MGIDHHLSLRQCICNRRVLLRSQRLDRIWSQYVRLAQHRMPRLRLTVRRVDVKALKTYQQLFIYIVPIITNLGFINIIPVAVRLRWFKKRLQRLNAAKESSSREKVDSKPEAIDIEVAAADAKAESPHSPTTE